MRRTIIWALLGVLLAVPAWAQVPIDRVPAIAQAVHDAERVNLGASSTRESRNAFWARVVGIIHFGHPTFNPSPDASWCIKDGGNGRPQSDDVIVKCRSREFWDCIPGSGADGYRFQCSFDGVLPKEQNVYIPPRPAGAGSIVPPPPPPPTTSLQPVLDALAALTAKVDAIAALSFAAREAALNATLEAASAAHDAREVNAWRMTFEPLKPVVFPCFKGRINTPFGGRDSTLCPVVP